MFSSSISEKLYGKNLKKSIRFELRMFGMKLDQVINGRSMKAIVLIFVERVQHSNPSIHFYTTNAIKLFGKCATKRGSIKAAVFQIPTALTMDSSQRAVDQWKSRARSFSIRTVLQRRISFFLHPVNSMEGHISSLSSITVSQICRQVLNNRFILAKPTMLWISSHSFPPKEG